MSRALVISGGGSKGAFAIGVLKRLFSEFPRLDFDILVGTSTGALIVPYIALRDLETVEKLYTTHKTEDIVLQGRLADRVNDVSIFDATPLKNVIAANFTDDLYARLNATGKELLLNTICLQTESLVVFTNKEAGPPQANYELKKLNNAEHFRRAVLASACQPVFMQPVKVNVNFADDPAQQFQYVDGGVREYAGIQMAIDQGATEIFTILLTADKAEVSPVQYRTLFPILSKAIDIFSEDVFKNDLAYPKLFNDALVYIDAVKKKLIAAGGSPASVNELFHVENLDNPFQDKSPVKMFVFKPASPLDGGPGGLTFDPVAMKEMLARGIGVGQDFVRNLDPADITWS